MAAARLVDCVQADPDVLEIDRLERALGLFGSGRVAWMLFDVRRVEPPVAVKGEQGLWDLDEVAHGLEVVRR